MSDSKSHYLTGVVVVSSDNVELAIDRLGGDVEFLELSEVLAIDPPDDQSLGEHEGALELMGDTVRFMRHADPPAAVNAMGEEDGQAVGSVINAVGFINHWSPFPGTWPQPVDLALDPVPDQSSDEFIGVIDSGIVPSGPAWLLDNVRYSTEDVESLPNRFAASHGTFIAGLLRRLACSYGISVVRLPLVHGSLFTSPGGSIPGFNVSTELHLYWALSRLLFRHTNDRLAALNLSLGTYTLSSLSSVIMKAAVDLWSRRAREIPIFAAGGNEYEPTGVYERVWPAGFAETTDVVKGVGAADPNGHEVVWDYHSQSSFAAVERVPPGARPWVKFAAPGTDLISLSGHLTSNGEPEVVAWSGSSFATPVALANYLNGGPDKTAHSDIEGLPYHDDWPRTVPWESSGCGPSAA